MELNKSIPSSQNKMLSQRKSTDGQKQDFLEGKGLIIVQLAETQLLVERYATIITKRACLRELRFLEQTPKSCQVSGSTKLVLAHQ